MSGEQNWRVPNGQTQAETYLGNQQKRNDLADRRPVIRKAADLVGPGIAAVAVRIDNFNDPLATYNGYFASPVGALAAPKAGEKFVGITIMDTEFGGVQRFTSLDSGLDYRRRFIRNPSDPESISWGAWQVGSGEVPIGALMPYAASTAPLGWLICDGASYSTLLYPDLFALIGTNFGGSGGSFNVPDLRDRTVYGMGSAWGLGTTDGMASGSRTMDLYHLHDLITNNAGDHVHPAQAQPAGNHNHGGSTGTPSSTVNRAFDNANPAAHPDHTHSISSGGEHEHTVLMGLEGDHFHTGGTFDQGEIPGLRLRGVGMRWLIRHGAA